MIPKPKVRSLSGVVFVIALVILLIMPASSTIIQAQEVTAEVTQEPVIEVTTEAPVTATEAPVTVTEAPVTATEVTEAATEAPDSSQPEATQKLITTTEAPTVEVTSEATEPVTEQPSVETTSEVTEAPTVEVTSTVDNTVIDTFVDDFEAFNTELWSLSGWSASNGVLVSNSANANASILNFSPSDFELNADLFVDVDNTALIVFRSGVEEYRAMFSSNGSMRLYRGDNILDTYAMPASDSAWFSVQIVAAGDTISVTVNGTTGIVFTDNPALASGNISFRTGTTNSGAVMLDNLSITPVDAASYVFPQKAAVVNTTPAANLTTEAETTVEPEATVETTTEAEMTVEPEATVEAETTAEAEVTVEPEMTVEPETTAEVTVEPESTEEAPVANVELSDDLTKVIDLINSGQIVMAKVVLDSSAYQFDETQRISLKIYAAEGVNIAELDQFLQTLNANVTDVKDDYLVAYVPLEQLPALSESPLIRQITKPASARSTGPVASPLSNPAGSAYTEGFDMLGVNDWHNHVPAFTGTGVKVGVIDTEFNGDGTSSEYSCLVGGTNNGQPKGHGLAMVEIICDLAPTAQVYTYTLGTNAYSSLASKIYQAITDQIDVLLIAAEITDSAPGDGTGLEDGSDDPYIALATARSQGMVVFAGAGNFGVPYQGGVPALERSLTLSVPAPSGDPTVATVKVRATPGDAIIVQWNDWTGLGDSGTGNLEDFDITVQLDPTMYSSTPAYPIYTYNHGRDFLSDPPSTALVLRPSIGSDPDFQYCPVKDTIGGGEYDPKWCYVDVIITRYSGDSPVTMQIMVAPQQQSAVQPTYSGPPDVPIFLKEHQEYDIEITGLTNLGTGVTQVNNTGTIARPADSPNVIAVGAVCATENSKYALTPDSSVGPIYGTDGVPSSISTTAPTNRNETKPDVVSASYVSTSGALANAGACDGSVSALSTTGGAGGTSAAAAHVAGMTAVLLSNPNFSNLDFDGVRNYIQSHSVELPLGASANGFDMSYGAGFFILGSPDYNLTNTQNPPTEADAINCSTLKYVGQANLDAAPTGTITQPYTSIAHAIANSIAGDCIVVMPGEYVTPIEISQNDIQLYAYNQVSSANYPASLINVSGQYVNGTVPVDSINFANNGGIYIDSGASGTVIDGFTFIHSSPYSSGAARHQAIFANGSINTDILNNSFGAITVDGASYSGFDTGDTTPIIIYNGDGVTVEHNTFNNNVGGILSDGKIVTPSMAILNSNAGSPILVRGNTFDSNTALEVRAAASYDYFASVLYAAHSNTDIVGNTFISNQANTIVNARTDNGGAEQLRVVSNLFQNNRFDTTTDGVDVTDLAGALVYGYYVPQLSFVNNTVVVNNFKDSGINGAILGRGSRYDNTGGKGAIQSFDFANNLVYGNTFLNGAGVISSQGTTVTQCNSLLGTSNGATVRNWWYSYTYSSCVAAINTNVNNSTTLNANNTASSPASIFFGVVYNQPNSTTNPLYYSLARVTDNPEPTPDVFSLAVDYSDIDTTTELGNNIDLSTAPFDLDLIGEARIHDTQNWELNSNAADNGVYLVDLGAFEFTSLGTKPLALNYNEDQPLIVIDLSQGIFGGIGQLTVTYPLDTLDEDGDGNTTEIRPSSLPSNFGTQCGTQFTQVNHGLVFGTGVNNLKAFYCPPPDFYTDADIADSYGIPDDISFGYSVTDETGVTVEGNASFSITPQTDATLSSAQDITGDQQTVIVNIGQSDVRVRLRPFINFNNFAFSERNNSAFFDGSNYAVDYPFTYSNISFDNPGLYTATPSFDIGTSPNQVYIKFSVVANQGGDSTITYTVTDANGGSSTNQILVRSVNRIPSVAGIYDDTSFAFDYTDGWKFRNATDAINDTLHSSQVANDVAGFGFKGTGFVLYMKGEGLLGGAWDLNLYIGSAITPATFSAWQEVGAGSGIYRSIVSDGGSVKFECSTTAIVSGELSSYINGYYTITCNSFDDGNSNDTFDSGEAAAVDTHLVEIVNTYGRKVTVDAFSLIDDTVTVDDVPLPPGAHDVDELALRGAFGSNWQEVFASTYSKGRAYQLVASDGSANDMVSFHVQGGTGFAIGTTLQTVTTDFTICVTNMTTGDLTCQNQSYNPPAILAAKPKVFRPFYGLTPDVATIYRVDIIPKDNLLVIDSVVVFDPSVAPVNTLAGGVEDEEVDKIVYGGGFDKNWDLNTLARGSSNQTLTSVVRTVRSPGPYIAFNVDSAIDTVYWTFGGRYFSTNAMICVDRGQGIGTNSNPSATVSNSYRTSLVNDSNTAHGNCIVVDMNTGTYSVINADGSTTPGVGSILLTKNTIILDESNFRTVWNNSNGIHTFEIFTLYDTNFSVDRLVAIGSGVPLPVGRYEEYTANISYLKDDLSTTATVETSEVGNPIYYTGDFTQVSGRAALRDSGSGVMFTNNYHYAIAFDIQGTGFAPAFRVAPTADEVLVCWQPSTYFVDYVTLVSNPASVHGTCQRFDNEDRRPSYNALRPILGLPFDQYKVIIRFEGDNFSPATNRAVEPAMWFDDVVVYNTDLSSLNQLSAGTSYEANYLNRSLLNNFAYFGNGWATLTGIRARNFSNQNVDYIRRGDVGATIAFRTTGANAITLTRSLGRYANYLICATNEADPTDRNCQTVTNDGRGFMNEITVYLTQSTVAPFANYTVTVTALDGNAFYFDAVRPESITSPLTPGIYDDNNPAIVYHYGSRNVVEDGDMEKNNAIVNYWANLGTPSLSNQVGTRYTGRFGWEVIASSGGDGIESRPFDLQAGVHYSMVARVFVDPLTPGTVTMQVGSNTAVSDINILGRWQTVRFDYTPVSLELGQTVKFVSSTGMNFYVDDVQVVEDSNWHTQYNPRAHGRYQTISTSHGSAFSFGFTGTGFALGIPVDRTSGEIQVCYVAYVPASGLPSADTIESSGTCVSYEDESLRPNNNSMRLIEGLTYGNYAVAVRDVEDGNSVTSAIYPIPRISRYAVGVIVLDYIYVFDNSSLVPVEQSGNYNENAANATGNPYLQFAPATSWDIVTGRAAARYSNQSYVTAVDANARQSRSAAGPAALLKLNVSSAVRVIFDTHAASRIASDQLLACVDGVDGDIVYDGTSKTYSIVDNNGPVNCVILDSLKTSRFVTLSPDNLPLLGVAGNHILTVQTLTGGAIIIDGYQVLYGNSLIPGFYEESIGKDILGASSEWVSKNYGPYSSGSALLLNNADGLHPNATMSFSFAGTGISIVSALAPNGGTVDIDIRNTGLGSSVCGTAPIPAADTVTFGDGTIDIPDTVANPQSLQFGSTVYGATITYAGLPCDTYEVTLSADAALNQQVVFDAIEVYGPMQTLGSLYDDALTDINGIPYITYGPTTTAWLVKEGGLAPTALNRTLHVAQRQGAVASFQIGETDALFTTVTKAADGIVLYYGAGSAITGDVEVCFRDVTNPATPECYNPTLVTTGGTADVSPSLGGAYYVTVSLLSSNRTFALDAVQVVEPGFHEGIFDATDIDGDSTHGYTGTGHLNTTTNLIELASGDTVNFDVTGVALSLVLSDTTTSSTSYKVCVGTSGAGSCDVVNENLPLAGDIVPVSGTNALTYAGLQNGSGAEQTLTVTLTNNGTGTLYLKELHVMSGDPSLMITDTARYENTDARIRYLPFGSMVENSAVRGNQSEGSENAGAIQGAAVYFEFKDLPTLMAPGFEYVRQMSLAYGSAEICYGQIADGVNVTTTESSSAVRNTNCTTVANNAVAAYQVADSIATNNYCEFGCWVTIRSVDSLTMPFDYVRLYDAGGAMTQGYYEDSYPGLNYYPAPGSETSSDGGTWGVLVPDGLGGYTIQSDLNRSADNRASGGFTTTATAYSTYGTNIDNTNGPIAWFVMNGTGFSAYFTADNKADAVEICYAPGAQTDINGVNLNVLGNGTCQTFDNENRRITYTAARTITGLPDGTYTVAIRMLQDNYTNSPHIGLTLPLSMKLDAVRVYSNDWTTLVPITPGQRYETSYDSRNLTNEFFYISGNWSSMKGLRARRESGQNYDMVREYGATVVFHTQNADAVTLYTDLSRAYSDLRACAVPVDGTISSITGEVKCLDFSLNGRGNQMPFSLRFHDFGLAPSTDYLVSITTLSNGQFHLDAIEPSLTGALTKGMYEGSDANLYYDNNYSSYIVNGSMEANADWTNVGAPSLSYQYYGSRFEGRFGWHVAANNGEGIESTGFNLTDAGVIYTVQARVRVLSGGVRIKLVRGTNPVSIQEFGLLEPTVNMTGLQWTTVRADFVLDASNVPYNDLHLQILANGSNTIFDVDDVRLTQGGLWTGSYDRRYTNGAAWSSLTPGASLIFPFEGTGVEIGTSFGRDGGEMELCYDDDMVFDETTETGNPQSCFTYQQESRRPELGVARTITGLPFGTYYVRLRDVEDGFTTLGRSLGIVRNARNPYGKIVVDYVHVLSNPLLEDVNNAVIPMSDLVVPPGYYNEDALNPATGKPYIQLDPETDWQSITGRFARNYSNQSYEVVANSNGRASRTEAGQAAVLYVDVPADGATVVLYTGSASRIASSRVLVCAGDGMSGGIIQEEYKVGIYTRLRFALESPNTPSDCVLRDMTSSGALIVNSDDLAALGTPGIQRVMFTSLATGQFTIDGYQIIHGTTLAPGIYDESLPDNLLNFDSSGGSAISDQLIGCDLDNFWCPRKVRGAYGDYIVQTQNLGASLNFNIEGTGFSILTEVGNGAQMRICYAQTPSSGSVTFPSRDDTLNNGNFVWDNSTQDIAAGGIWCQLFTTNTYPPVWNSINPDRIDPLRGEQYGFAFYGLPYGKYSVQAILFENIPVGATPTLGIDGVVVFSDYSKLPVMGPGLYDDSEANFSLEPVTSWTESNSRFGPPRGPYNLTESTSSNAGSIAQMQIDGNSVTLFETVNIRNTADARICMVVTSAVIHCTTEAGTSAMGIKNPDASAPPYALAVELASFSQSGRRSYFAPIMFYGLGESNATYPHQIIIENRQHGRILSLDALLVQK